MLRRPLVWSILVAVAAGVTFLAWSGRLFAGTGAPGPVSFGFEPGERVVDFTLTDVNGKAARLSELAASKAVVIAVRDVSCPVSQKYGPRLAELEREFAARGVEVVLLNLNKQDTREQIQAEIARFGFTGRYVWDPDGKIGQTLRVSSTGEVFVLDGSRTLRYRGPIDDQYGVGYDRPTIKHPYLRKALESVLAGAELADRKVTAPGCALAFDPVAERALDVTYHNRISRIIQNNCQTCHRVGGVAPFPLETYDQVFGRRAMIAYMTENHRMPPWFAHRDVGQWANDRSLSERDLNDLLAWAKGKAPEGDPRDGPLPRTWVAGWNIGKPDAILEIPKPFDIPAQGVVDYQYMYVKTDFPEDRWIERMEIRPTAPEAVHHVLVFLEAPLPPGKEPGPDFQGGIDGFFAATVPGTFGTFYPEGAAKRLPKGSWLKFQIHYTPRGTAKVDQTRLALVFAKGPPEQEVATGSAYNAEFAIPPGAPNHEVKAEYVFKRAGTLLSFFPHMHLRGKAFRYDLVLPDGSEQELLRVPRYDFNWQLFYSLKTPLPVPAGARLRATAWYDNSTGNPFNPDPSKEVKFGEQTSDEMMIGYFDWLPAPHSNWALGTRHSASTN